MASNSEHLLHKKQATLAQAKAFVTILENQVNELSKLIELERKTLAMQDSPFEVFLRGDELFKKQLSNAVISEAFVIPSSIDALANPSSFLPRNTKNAVSSKIIELLEESNEPLTVAEIYEALNTRLENLSTRGSVRGTLHALAANNKIVAHGQGRYSKNGIAIATKGESPAPTGLSCVTESESSLL